jgi:hypothetical protein
MLFSINPIGWTQTHMPWSGEGRKNRTYSKDFTGAIGQNQGSMSFRSPLTINKGFKGGMPSGEIVFPQLDPDLFKRKAEETGKSLGGSKGNTLYIQEGAIIIQSEDPEKIKQIVINALVEASKRME